MENDNLSIKERNKDTKSNKCNQCDYASTKASNLRAHLKTHNGERLYKCNQCGYASLQAGRGVQYAKS